jgi:hypothetical protein
LKKLRNSTAWILAAAFLLCGVGCKKPVSDQDAIRASVAQHLKSNGTLNMAAMDMDFAQVVINGDSAQAQVVFRLKQGGATMQVAYNLKRQDGAWTVLKSQPAGGQFEHPAMDPHADVHSNAFRDLHTPLGDLVKPLPATTNPPASTPGHAKPQDSTK